MQNPEQIHCPSCGALAPFRGTAVSLVCDYCNTTIVRSGVDVRMVGKVSAILDTGSPILLNAQGRHRGLPFVVAGRLQVRYARGTWNEWFLEFADSTTGWLGDAQGSFSVTRPKEAGIVDGQVPRFSELAAGYTLVIDGTPAVVTDRRAASYQGAEGILPFEAEPGLTFFAADLRGYQGEFFSLDYGTAQDHARPALYVGESIRLSSLELHPLRSFEGWP